jgi:hypothetical protein
MRTKCARNLWAYLRCTCDIVCNACVRAAIRNLRYQTYVHSIHGILIMQLLCSAHLLYAHHPYAYFMPACVQNGRNRFMQRACDMDYMHGTCLRTFFVRPGILRNTDVFNADDALGYVRIHGYVMATVRCRFTCLDSPETIAMRTRYVRFCTYGAHGLARYMLTCSTKYIARNLIIRYTLAYDAAIYCTIMRCNAIPRCVICVLRAVLRGLLSAAILYNTVIHLRNAHAVQYNQPACVTARGCVYARYCTAWTYVLNAYGAVQNTIAQIRTDEPMHAITKAVHGFVRYVRYGRCNMRLLRLHA